MGSIAVREGRAVDYRDLQPDYIRLSEAEARLLQGQCGPDSRAEGI
jgi:hypothetical protein